MWIVLDDISDARIVLERSMTLDSFIVAGTTAAVLMDKNEFVEIMNSVSA